MVFKKTSSLSSISEVEKKQYLGKWVKKILSKRSIQIVIAIIIMAVIIGGGYYQFQKKNSVPSEGGKLSSNEIENLLEEVGENFLLPIGETPDIATVTDVTKLENNAFYRNAKNGDKVLIFKSIKEAILYRPSIQKIIAVAPFNVTPDASVPQTNQTQATPSSALATAPAKAAEKLKVVVLNSTKEAGLAKKGADLLDKDVSEVISTANAKGEYDATTVSSVSNIKISDSQLKSLVSVFSKIKPSVSSLPSGETAPAGADVVIILGSDFSESY